MKTDFSLLCAQPFALCDFVLSCAPFHSCMQANMTLAEDPWFEEWLQRVHNEIEKSSFLTNQANCPNFALADSSFVWDTPHVKYRLRCALEKLEELKASVTLARQVHTDSVVHA